MRAFLLAFAIVLVGCPTEDPDPTPTPTPTPSDDDDAVDDDDADDDDAVDDDDVTGTPPCDSLGSPERTGEVDDNDLDEISGLGVSRQHDDLLWVHMDSGAKSPEVTALQYDGDTLGTVVLTQPNRDWEDLAMGPCDASGGNCVWIADAGDNDADHAQVFLIRFVEPAELPGSNDWRIEVEADVFPYTYPEGPQDVEALVVGPDGVPTVLTKREDGTTLVYRFDAPLVPDTPTQPTLLKTAFTVPVILGGGIAAAATGADLWPDGSRLILRTYLQTREFFLADNDMANMDIDSSEQVFTALEAQGEAIAYDPRLRAVRHVAEARNAPLWLLPCTEE